MGLVVVTILQLLLYSSLQLELHLNQSVSPSSVANSENSMTPSPLRFVALEGPEFIKTIRHDKRNAEVAEDKTLMKGITSTINNSNTGFLSEVQGQNALGRRPTALICDLKIAVYPFSHTSPIHSANLLLALKHVDKIFRSLDIDADGSADNIGFSLSTFIIEPEPRTEVGDTSSFFAEFDHYGLDSSCAGLLLAYSSNSSTKRWPLKVEQLSPKYPYQGICSGSEKSNPITDYEEALTNVLPLNLYVNEPLTDAVLKIVHQLGHLFGARDDVEYDDGNCLKGSDNLKFIMHLPISSKDNSFKMSKCSLGDLKKFWNFGNTDCLIPCYKMDGCVQDFLLVKPRLWKKCKNSTEEGCGKIEKRKRGVMSTGFTIFPHSRNNYVEMGMLVLPALATICLVAILGF